MYSLFKWIGICLSILLPTNITKSSDTCTTMFVIKQVDLQVKYNLTVNTALFDSLQAYGLSVDSSLFLVAQARIESGVELSSGLAREGKNLWGAMAFGKVPSMLLKNRATGKTFRWRVYTSWREAIHDRVTRLGRISLLHYSGGEEGYALRVQQEVEKLKKYIVINLEATYENIYVIRRNRDKQLVATVKRNHGVVVSHARYSYPIRNGVGGGEASSKVSQAKQG